MIEVAKETEIERKINSLVKQAWEFGRSCEIDDITNFNETGDSHIEFLRDNLNKAKDDLYLLMLSNV